MTILFLFLSFYFWYSHSAFVTSFVVVPQFLIFCSFLNSVCISVLELSLDISSGLLILIFRCVQSFDEPSKTFFIYFIDPLHFILIFFLEFLSLCVHYPSVLTCCPPFPLRSLAYYSYFKLLL